MQMTLLYSHQLHEAEPALNKHNHPVETSHRMIIKIFGHLPVAIKVLCHTVGLCAVYLKGWEFVLYIIIFLVFLPSGQHNAVDCTPTIFSRTWYVKSVNVHPFCDNAMISICRNNAFQELMFSQKMIQINQNKACYCSQTDLVYWQTVKVKCRPC